MADPEVQRRLAKFQKTYDGVDITLGCRIDRSPEEVALGYLNNCAYACAMKPVFQFSYYVGTFGEYDRGAVLSCQTVNHRHGAGGERRSSWPPN